MPQLERNGRLQPDPVFCFAIGVAVILRGLPCWCTMQHSMLCSVRAATVLCWVCARMSV